MPAKKKPRRGVSRADRLLQMAELALLQNQTVRAEKLARKALALNRFRGEAWFLIGNSLLARQQNQAAAIVMAKAFALLGQQLAHVAYVLAVANDRLGKSKENERLMPLVALDKDMWQLLGEETQFDLTPLAKKREETDMAFR